ncbi:prepilin peptidase [Kitasatospora sp. NPDC058965]|uniref:prepilin peptidase n=1 Tax=Kitasatospora sp. NPDC058965 TaxID=3346682 RepID=UPI0036C7490D
MSYSPVVLALAAALGLAAGVFVVRPVVFAFTVYEGWRRTCPHCGSPVLGAGAGAYADLVLRRRCRTCSTDALVSATAPAAAGIVIGGSAGGPIGPAAWVPELLTAAAVAGFVAAGSSGWLLAVQLWLAVLGAAMVLIDLKEQRLPHLLTGLSAAGVVVYLGALAVTGSGWPELVLPCLGAAVVGGVLWLMERLGMLGMGDVLLAPSLAAVLASQSGATLYWGLVAQFAIGFAMGGARLLLTGNREVALGPGLVLGALVVSAAAG